MSRAYSPFLFRRWQTQALLMLAGTIALGASLGVKLDLV